MQVVPVKKQLDPIASEHLVLCRREFRSFATGAADLGINELVLALLYVDDASFHEAEPSDDLVALFKTFQYEDWTDLRFADLGSEAYRRGVVRLATRLVEANKQADRAVAANARVLEVSPEEEPDEALGDLDRLAASERAMTDWGATLVSMGEDVELIGAMMTEATADTQKADAQGKGFAGRLVVTRQLALKLKDPTDRIWANGNLFASQLHQVDDGVRLIIGRAPAELQENPEFIPDVCEYFESLRTLADSTRDSLESTQGMIDSIGPLETSSRDLRAPLKRLRQGLTRMLEAGEITEEWVRLIDESGVDCSDVKEP